MSGRFTQHWHNARATCGLSRPVARFVRQRVASAAARTEIRRALDERESAFLRLVESRIYRRESSPYLKLLRRAGCAYGDLEAHARTHGLENTLEKLAGEGVYLTAEEFKGKQKVVRGALSFRVTPDAFAHAAATAVYWIHSSGTVNPPIKTGVALDWLAARALAAAVFFEAHELFFSAHAMYDAVLPASGAVNNILIYNRLGVPVERWFALAVPGDKSRHHLATYAIALAARIGGAGFPLPQPTALGDARRIVAWLEQRRRDGRRCCVTTAASNAVRVARAASDMGVALDGAKFVCSGEPLTDAKRDIIERAGARPAARYAYGGGVNIGFGCGDPAAADEIHVNEHLLALIAHPRRATADLPHITPLLCTTIHPDAPRLLLNVESGDYGVLTRRDCGCALEKSGLGLHLHSIRSFEKFTSEGVNYNYAGLFAFVEKILPDEFGGGPGDYQLREEEDARGNTRIALVVDPAVGAVDEQKLLLRLTAALESDAWTARLWTDAGTLRVRREAPHASARGKILPLHIARRFGAS